METWKEIRNSAGYEVSNKGNIRRFGNPIKTSIWSKYRVVRIKRNGDYKTEYVHRLVAEAFVCNQEHKEFVNHLDGNKLNNDAENLEWCTRQENEIHAWRHGMKEKIRETSRENVKIARTKVNNKIPVIQKTLDGVAVRIWDSASDAMKEIGVDSSAISKCCKGKFAQSGGFVWEYLRQKSE